MTSPRDSTTLPEALASTNRELTKRYPVLKWSTLPNLSQLKFSTLFDGFGRRFFNYAPGTILKLGTDEGEADMTDLAHDLLGSAVPRLDALVMIAAPYPQQGLLITLLPGKSLEELWPTLESASRVVVKKNLVALLLRTRQPHESLNYYGRPGRQPYITPSEIGPHEKHSFCGTRKEWDASRSRALHLAGPEIDLDQSRMRELERSQNQLGSDDLAFVASPVLTHSDLSDRNILVDPTTLEVTGLIDWEMANVTPAYFEYAAARLSGGHQPEWRKELLDVLRQVLRKECEREVSRRCEASKTQPTKEQCDELFTEALAAWNSFVDVERSAQGFSSACLWTFEDDDDQTRKAVGA